MDIKIGDRVRCLPGFCGSAPFFGDNYGGYGYEEDLIFRVTRIDNYPGRNVLWGITANEGGGVFEKAVVKVEEFTPFPIVKKHYFLDSLK
jgi:hypothetical protein